MDSDIKARWVDALRSGDYNQTDGLLCRADAVSRQPVGYCCLGVLCDLAVQDGVIPAPTDLGTKDELAMDESRDSFRYGDSDDYSSTSLPDAVRVWAGLADWNPTVEITNEYGYYAEDEDGNEVWVADEYTATNSLAELNDGGKSFKDIARYIEHDL